MEYVLIIGAKSDIAKSLAREYANNGYNLYLAARNVNSLEGFASDVRIKTQKKVKLLEFDVLNFDEHSAFYEQLEYKPVGLISAVGYLGRQEESEINFLEFRRVIDVNFTGIASIFNIVSQDMKTKGRGFIIGISSVAGDRGRESNFTYGSAKAAFSAYLSGLRGKLDGSGIHVLTVKPGFVDTQMTRDMHLPKLLTANPSRVAKKIYISQAKKRDVIYVLGVWWAIMIIIKIIPEKLFKKLGL